MTTDHTQLMNRYIDDLDVIAQKSVEYSASRVPMGTRKFSGQAQASTTVGVGDPDPSVVLATVYSFNAIPDSMARGLRRIREASKRVKPGDVAYVSNNLPYIAVLEYELGDLMFNKAVRHWQEDVDRAISHT